MAMTTANTAATVTATTPTSTPPKFSVQPVTGTKQKSQSLIRFGIARATTESAKNAIAYAKPKRKKTMAKARES